MRRNPTLPTIR
jgi:hypothetical protein